MGTRISREYDSTGRLTHYTQHGCTYEDYAITYTLLPEQQLVRQDWLSVSPLRKDSLLEKVVYYKFDERLSKLLSKVEIDAIKKDILYSYTYYYADGKIKEVFTKDHLLSGNNLTTTEYIYNHKSKLVRIQSPSFIQFVSSKTGLLDSIIASCKTYYKYYQ
jgi:hypothetical protein